MAVNTIKISQKMKNKYQQTMEKKYKKWRNEKDSQIKAH